MLRAKRGDWVSIHKQLLAAGQRAPQVPEDTQHVPLEMWVKGFLIDEEAKVGETVRIKTVTGREVVGSLAQILPAYQHSFGNPQPELLSIGLELRDLLREECK